MPIDPIELEAFDDEEVYYANSDMGILVTDRRIKFCGDVFPIWGVTSVRIETESKDTSELGCWPVVIVLTGLLGIAGLIGALNKENSFAPAAVLLAIAAFGVSVTKPNDKSKTKTKTTFYRIVLHNTADNRFTFQSTDRSEIEEAYNAINESLANYQRD